MATDILNITEYPINDESIEKFRYDEVDVDQGYANLNNLGTQLSFTYGPSDSFLCPSKLFSY